MQLLSGLVQVLDTEDDSVEDVVALCIIVQVNTQLHSLAEGLQQLLDELIALQGTEAADGEVDLLGDDGLRHLLRCSRG